MERITCSWITGLNVKKSLSSSQIDLEINKILIKMVLRIIKENNIIIHFLI